MPQDRRRGRRRYRDQHWQQPSGTQHPDLLSMGQHARGLVAAAFAGVARHVSGQSSGHLIPGATVISSSRDISRPGTRSRPHRPSRRDHRTSAGHDRSASRGRPDSQHRPGSQDKTATSGKTWTVTPSKRSELIVGKGDISQVFECLTQLWTDCPGAGIAICRFLTMHQWPSEPTAEYTVERAGNSLTRFLRKAVPNDRSLRSAKHRLQEARSSSNPKGFLTAQTTYLEEIYLRFVHDLDTDGMGLRQLAQAFVHNADRFAEADSEGRQAYPRIMAADCYLQLGDITNANIQIALAYYLIGKAYPNKALVDLGESLQEQSGVPAAAGQQVGAGASSRATDLTHQ